MQLFHYRNRDQVEADVVPEHANGDIVRVKVKASQTVRGGDFRAAPLSRRLGRRFKAGLVLYAGGEALSFGQGMRALPIAALWKLGPGQ